ncbi:MAG: DUF1793 domain-containing protein [Planctomycetes bacterium]|nr:DUF1793 domain-containing protein [Planctomycetota bacterium]
MKGWPPESVPQLCTDDFAGHLAHNVNLSAKAILALGAYARLAERLGKKEIAAEFQKLARTFAERWVKAANDGDRFCLAFDRPGTWSQKYNLVWDRILGLGLFPEAVLEKEMAFYRKTQNRYGLPLDVRQPYTKLDWTLWTAALTGARQDFDALLEPVYRFLEETPDRIPMTDWYRTTDGRKVGFQARSVVGGVFIRMLYDPELWRKWAKRDKTILGAWAPLPAPPEVKVVVPTAREHGIPWRYTFERPGDGWFKPGFAASGWKEGPAGFGTKGTPGAVVRTDWRSPDIWLRRKFTLPEGPPGNPQLLIHHDEDIEVYVNGVLAAQASSYTTDYELLPLNPAGKAALQRGENLLAVHCHQTGGGQYIDLGIVEVRGPAIKSAAVPALPADLATALRLPRARPRHRPRRGGPDSQRICEKQY